MRTMRVFMTLFCLVLGLCLVCMGDTSAVLGGLLLVLAACMGYYMSGTVSSRLR